MSHPSLIDIGTRLKKTRKTLGYKQEQFAELLNTTNTSLSEYETAKTRPSFELLFYLSVKFNINLDYLLHGESEMFKNGQNNAENQTALNFGDLSDEIEEILQTMKASKYALSGIYTLAKEFLHRNQAIIDKEINRNKDKIKNIEKSKQENKGGGT